MTRTSTWSLGVKLGLATAAAAALLVAVVLPAEYGIDPTGLGGVTGLSALNEEASAPVVNFAEGLDFNIEDYDSSAEIIDRSIKGLITLEEAPVRSETIDLVIEDFGEIEYKFIMPADSTLVYSWSVPDAKGDGVYYEFHGHPSGEDAPDYPEGFELAYSKGEGRSQNGSFTAPFPGYHGFYLMNLEEGPITVRLTVSGYWNEHKEMYRAIDGEVITNVDF